MKTLRILSIGAGAIGTYIGGSLALAGNEVVFLERPDTASSIQVLKLNLDGHQHIIKQPLFVNSIGQAIAQGPYDVALFALKSFDTERALEEFKPFSHQLPPFLCLQNGVENESIIENAIGVGNVIPATVTSAIGKPGLGEIVLEKLRGVGISSQHQLSSRLQQAFNIANLNAELFDQPLAMKWSKMLTNLVSNATSAILALPPGEIFSHQKLFQIEMAQLKEALHVMKANGIPVVNLPGTPVQLLALTAQFIPQIISKPILTKAVIGGRGDKMPSFFIDLTSGRRESEVEYLNGAVVRWGKRINIPTPVNSFLTNTLIRMVRGEIPKDSYKNRVSKFIQDFSNWMD